MVILQNSPHKLTWMVGQLLFTWNFLREYAEKKYKSSYAKLWIFLLN